MEPVLRYSWQNPILGLNSKIWMYMEIYENQHTFYGRYQDWEINLESARK